jgi:hypothetical protein
MTQVTCGPAGYGQRYRGVRGRELIVTECIRAGAELGRGEQRRIRVTLNQIHAAQQNAAVAVLCADDLDHQAVDLAAGTGKQAPAVMVERADPVGVGWWGNIGVFWGSVRHVHSIGSRTGIVQRSPGLDRVIARAVLAAGGSDLPPLVSPPGRAIASGPPEPLSRVVSRCQRVTRRAIKKGSKVTPANPSVTIPPRREIGVPHVVGKAARGHCGCDTRAATWTHHEHLVSVCCRCECQRQVDSPGAAPGGWRPD